MPSKDEISTIKIPTRQRGSALGQVTQIIEDAQQHRVWTVVYATYCKIEGATCSLLYLAMQYRMIVQSLSMISEGLRSHTGCLCLIVEPLGH